MTLPDSIDGQSESSFRRTDPIFIVGCPRSGTTLLSALFDRHSQVAVTPESFYFQHFCQHVLRGRRRVPAGRLVQLFTEGRYTRDLQLDPSELLKRAGTSDISVTDFFHIALNLFAEARGKPRCAEKTPIHLYYAAEIIKHYPQSRVICIYRDGRDCALSLRNLQHSIPSLRGYAAFWREFVPVMLRCQQEFPNHFRTVRYESLLEQPVIVLTSLMSFVGLDFEPGQLDPSQPTGVCTEWDVSYKGNIYSEIDPNRAYAWKRSASPRELRIMNSAMRPYLGQLGYDPGDATLGNWPTRIYDRLMNAAFRVAFAYRFLELRRIARYILRPIFGMAPSIRPVGPMVEHQKKPSHNHQ